MNKYYCESGHMNVAANGVKPAYCGSCGKKMGVTSSFTPKVVETPKRSFADQIKTLKQQTPYQNQLPKNDDSQDEDISNIDATELDYELDMVDVRQGFTVDKIAAGIPVTEKASSGKKLSKAASKRAFKNLRENVQAKSSKEF